MLIALSSPAISLQYWMWGQEVELLQIDQSEKLELLKYHRLLLFFVMIKRKLLESWPNG
jgi:hypothetical protein